MMVTLLRRLMFKVSSLQFKNLDTMDTAVINMEAQCCPDYVKALNTGRSGIHYQHAATPVVSYNLEDMRMAAYKQVRSISVYKFPGTGIVLSRITSDMSHKDLYSFTFKETMQRMFKPEIIVITVACHSHKRFEGCDLLSQVHAATKITCMPDLVHRLEKATEAGVKYSVCI
jgi:hypothetical protein